MMYFVLKARTRRGRKEIQTGNEPVLTAASNRVSGACWIRALVLGLSLVTGGVVSTMLPVSASAQETTGGVSGVIKDASGAVIASAAVEVSGGALIGVKKLTTNGAGQYRFVNLPPGIYQIKVTAQGFETAKVSDITIGVGRYPSIDISLKVGGEGTTVEVSADAVSIEQTTTHALTNISSQEIEALPHGASFQSLIALAPAARNEPLQDSGYQINGGANAENSYLVEGQETASVISGVSKANVPMEFIQEVQVKTSGIEAEYQGSMSGTVNVIMKKGSEAWHGQFFNYYQPSSLEPIRHGYLRYNPDSAYTSSSAQSTSYNGSDQAVQYYVPKKDLYHRDQPGGQVGGPLWKNHIWGNAAFAPEYYTRRRTISWGGTSGDQTYLTSTEQYYFNARVDATVNSRVRLFATWLTQYYRSTGGNSDDVVDGTNSVAPNADSTNGLVNSSVSSGVSAFPADLGTVQPNQNFNVGADITIKSNLIATTRFGHYFTNYGDRGWPNAPVYVWMTSGEGATNLAGYTFASGDSLYHASGYQTGALESIYSKNATKHDQLTQDLEWFKNSRLGTHDVKFGYGLNHLYNDVSEGYNGPLSRIYPAQQLSAAGTQGQTNCANIAATNLANYGVSGATITNGAYTKCQGLDGYVYFRDYGVSGQAASWNHGFYLQDEWQVRHDLTVNLGVRFDKEYLPAYPNMKATANPIDFGWGDKIGPRAGVAWNVGGKDKLKISASYGKFYDQMKLSLAIDSFGGAFWHNCYYALDTQDYSSLIPTRASNGHYCSGTGDANFSGGTVPTSIRFVQNLNYRADALESVDPNLKPYSQHETTVGVEYQVNPQWVLTGRWDRRRLDHVIEDAGFLDSDGNENFSIVNPGEGIDQYISVCSACSANIKAARSYDGLEFALKHRYYKGFQTDISYTWSSLRGNYSGLTSTDLADGGGGRESANDNRSFDEPYFQYDAYGRSSSGLLATDRPHAVKIDGSYQKIWSRRHATSLGIFQEIMSGSPLSSYMDVGESDGYPVYVEGRGKWVNVTTDSNGFAVWGSVSKKRTDAFLQTDANLAHAFKVNDKHTLNVSAIVTNVLNQRAGTEIYSRVNSPKQLSDVDPSGTGTIDYYQLTHKYDYKSLFNTDNVLVSNEYGKPYAYQTARTFRIRIGYTF